jgi:hypothetical protein
MSKVEECILSEKYSIDTCVHLIKAISNVSGEANTVMIFFKTITEIYYHNKKEIH